MSKPMYYELLRDPRWQRKRLEVMQDAGFKCEECGTDQATLNVHHQYYKKNAVPWDYPDNCFKCLCEYCHGKRHEKQDIIKFYIGTLPTEMLERIHGYVLGLYLADTDNDDAHVSLENAEVVTGFCDTFGRYREWLEGYVIMHVEDSVFLKTDYEALQSDILKGAGVL